MTSNGLLLCVQVLKALDYLYSKLRVMHRGKWYFSVVSSIAMSSAYLSMFCFCLYFVSKVSA